MKEQKKLVIMVNTEPSNQNQSISQSIKHQEYFTYTCKFFLAMLQWNAVFQGTLSSVNAIQTKTTQSDSMASEYLTERQTDPWLLQDVENMLAHRISALQLIRPTDKHRWLGNTCSANILYLQNSVHWPTLTW